MESRTGKEVFVVSPLATAKRLSKSGEPPSGFRLTQVKLKPDDLLMAAIDTEDAIWNSNYWDIDNWLQVG